MSTNELGWDMTILKRLLDGYGYVDSKTGKLYVWMPSLGEQDATSTLENLMRYVMFLKNREWENDSGEESEGLKVGGLAG